MRCAAVTQNVFLRSPNRDNAYNVFYVNSSGNLNNTNACNGNRVRPDRIGGTSVNTDIADIEWTYADARSQSPALVVGREQSGGDVGTACSVPAISVPSTFLDPICEDALYEAAMRCFTGVRWKPSVARVELNLPLIIHNIRESFENGTYRPHEPRRFTIYYPKKRDIVAVHINDRILQRSLNDFVFYPSIAPHLIEDNWACQTGKGTDYARNRFRSMLRSHVREHGVTGYICYVDIWGYYGNMTHAVAAEPFYRYAPKRWADFANMIITTQYGTGDGRGVNPGSQLIQIAGISVPNELDHTIKDQLQFKRYGRYMDDMVCIVENMEQAELFMRAVGEGLAKLGLEPHPKKSKVVPLAEGLTFLGFDFKPLESGRVLMTVTSSSVRRERRHLKGIVRLAKAGGLTRKQANDSYHGWRAHASKGDSSKLIKRMDAYYKNLWKE